MKVTIQGPNLRYQSKGQFHVHAADCGDNRHYGAGGKYGGEDHGWTIDAKNVSDVVDAVYGDQMDEGATYCECLADFWFAPCLGSWGRS